jgi:hypothetical protein
MGTSMRTKPAWLAVSLLLLGGCFSPDLPATITCGLDGTCPPGLRCETSANVCVDPSQAGVAELHFETQPASVEAGVDAPEVVVQLRDRAGRIVPVTGGTFAVELAANDAGVNLLGSVIHPAMQGVVSFEKLKFDRPARGLRLIIHGGDLSASSSPFDVTTTRPAVLGISVGGVVDSCTRVTYKLQQAQGLPVKLLVEFDPDGPSGPLPFRRATQAGSDPGKAGVDGVPGEPQGSSRIFTWNTTTDVPGVDATGVLRITPSVEGATGTAYEAPVTVRNGPRFGDFSFPSATVGVVRFLDSNRDGAVYESSVDYAARSLSLEGMDTFPLPEGASVNDYNIGDFDGDGALDLVVALSTGTVVAKRERGPAGHLGASIPVAAAFRQVVTADLDHDGLADIVGVDAATGDVVILRPSRGTPGHFAEASRPWQGGDTGQVRLADLDRDGWQDLVIGRATATSPVALVRGSAAGFAAPTLVSSLQGDRVAVADLDLDGRDDVASTDAAGLHVLASAAGRVDVPGLTGQAIAMKDVDGDRLPDVVVASADHVYVYAHAHAPHDVAFLPAVTVGAATNVSSLFVDGFGFYDRPDITTVREGSGESSLVIFNNATPRRCNARLASPLVSSYSTYGGGVLADVNRDGKVDYVALRGGVGEHGQLVALLGRGDGTFSPAADPLYEWAESALPRSLTAADFDGDGAVDLAFDSFGIRALTIFYNDPSAPGTLSPFALPLDYPEGFSVADLDHDGALDLVILDDGQVQIRHGEPGDRRTFGAPAILPTVVDTARELGLCRYFCETFVADLDADGHLDILVETPSQLFIFRGDPGAADGFSEPFVESLPDRGVLKVLDAFGDARPELFFGNHAPPGSDVGGYLSAYDLTTTGLALEQVWQGPPTTDLNEDYSAPFSIDLDGDGEQEIMVRYFGRLARLGRGPAPQLSLLSPAYYSDVNDDFSTADVDGDGHEDLLIGGHGGVVALRFDEHGPRDLGTLLSPRGADDPGGFGNALSVGDFSGDGRPDLAVRDNVTHEIALLRQSADHPGTLDPGEVTLPGYTRSGFADLDGDRRDDLITYGGTAGSLFYPDPGEPGSAGRCVADWNGFPFAVGDVDNDGRADVVESSYAGVLFLPAPADACPLPVPVMSLDRPGVPHWHPQALKLADLNRDGFLDVVVATDAVRVALQDPDAPGTFTVTDYERQLRTDQQPYVDFEIADVNNDRALDVVVIDGNYAVRIFLAGPTPGAFLPSTVIPDTLDGAWTCSISLGDVNDDGSIDLVLNGYHSNRVFLQYSDPSDPTSGRGQFSYAYRTIGANTSVYDAEATKVVDFDGDGRSDLVYVDPRQGTMLLKGN